MGHTTFDTEITRNLLTHKFITEFLKVGFHLIGHHLTSPFNTQLELKSNHVNIKKTNTRKKCINI